MFCFHHYVESKDQKSVYCDKCGNSKPIACNHKFELIQTIDVHSGYDDDYDGIPIAYLYITKCKNCGKIEQVTARNEI